MVLQNKKYFAILLLLILFKTTIYSQNKRYNQFWSEVTFNGTLNKQWTTEFDYVSRYSSQLDKSNLFYTNIQRSYTGWANYYGGARWKFSGGIGYFSNNNANNIGLPTAPEWRFSLQGTYYIHKIGYTLSTRMRLEARDLKSSDGEYGIVFRYRQQIKYLQPINSQFLRKGVYYGFLSDELFFQTNANETVLKFFNRNRLNIGAGYLITDDFHIEASYFNDYQPTETYDKITNMYSVKLIYNNLGRKILTKFKDNNTTDQQDDSLPTKN